MADSFRGDTLAFEAYLKADLAAATPKSTKAVVVRHWGTKTVLVHSDQAGEGSPPSDVTVDVLVRMRDGEYTPLQGASGGLAKANKIFAFSFEDIFEEIKVQVTPGATLPGRISIQVNAGRVSIG